MVPPELLTDPVNVPEVDHTVSVDVRFRLAGMPPASGKGWVGLAQSVAKSAYAGLSTIRNSAHRSAATTVSRGTTRRTSTSQARTRLDVLEMAKRLQPPLHTQRRRYVMTEAEGGHGDGRRQVP